MSSSLDLSIIITSYNTSKILVDCLNSIYRFTKNINFEVVIVDNASTDDTISELKKIEKKHSNLHVHSLDKNYGFGLANNIGVQKARGQFLLFLNSDTLFTSNICLDSVVEMKQIKNCGVYSCSLKNSDGTAQPSGGFFPTLANLIAWQLFIDDLPLVGEKVKSIHPHEPGFVFWQRLLKVNKKNKTVIKHVQPDWVTGAFTIIPKHLFEKVSGFDENIFMYTEEMELIYRISKLGYKTFQSSNKSIIHLGGASGGSFLAITSEIKNLIYFWQKHRPGWELPIVRSVMFIGSLLRLILFGIIKKDETHRRAYLESLKLCF